MHYCISTEYLVYMSILHAQNWTRKYVSKRKEQFYYFLLLAYWMLLASNDLFLSVLQQSNNGNLYENFFLHSERKAWLNLGFVTRSEQRISDSSLSITLNFSGHFCTAIFISTIYSDIHCIGYLPVQWLFRITGYMTKGILNKRHEKQGLISSVESLHWHPLGASILMPSLSWVFHLHTPSYATVLKCGYIFLVLSLGAKPYRIILQCFTDTSSPFGELQ